MKIPWFHVGWWWWFLDFYLNWCSLSELELCLYLVIIDRFWWEILDQRMVKGTIICVCVCILIKFVFVFVFVYCFDLCFLYCLDLCFCIVWICVCVLFEFLFVYCLNLYLVRTAQYWWERLERRMDRGRAVLSSGKPDYSQQRGRNCKDKCQWGQIKNKVKYQ